MARLCFNVCVLCVFEWAGGTKELHNLFDLMRKRNHMRDIAHILVHH